MATEEKFTTPGPAGNIVRCADCGASWCRVCCELWVPFGQGGPAGGDDALAVALDRFRAHCHEAHGNGDRESDARRAYTRLFGAIVQRRRPGETLSGDSIAELLTDIEHDLIAHCGWTPDEVAMPGLAGAYEARASRASERCERCIEGPGYDIDSADELSGDRLKRELARERAHLDPAVASARSETREPLGRKPRKRTREEVREETFVAIMRRIVVLADRASTLISPDAADGPGLGSLAPGLEIIAFAAWELSAVGARDWDASRKIERDPSRLWTEGERERREKWLADVHTRHAASLVALKQGFSEVYYADAALTEAAIFGSKREVASWRTWPWLKNPKARVRRIRDPMPQKEADAAAVALVRAQHGFTLAKGVDDAAILRAIGVYRLARLDKGRPRVEPVPGVKGKSRKRTSGPQSDEAASSALERAEALGGLLQRKHDAETTVRLLRSAHKRAAERIEQFAQAPAKKKRPDG